ncbi:MAG: membrane protein insertase YidC [Neomegalonema sp.]|nr:membrane protein insertase YidC [Neomegalonema sp.]
MQQQQPSPEETRNLILATVLCLAVFVIWQVLFPPPTPPKTAEDPAKKTEISATTKDAPTPGAAVLDRKKALGASERITIDTPALKGSLALTGGVIDELRLKRYGVSIEKESERVELLHPRRTSNAYFANFGWREGVSYAPGLSTKWLLAPGSPRTLTPEKPIKLIWDNGKGLVFRREISVDKRYMFSVTQTIENRGESAVSLTPYARISRHGTPKTQGFWVLHEGVVGVVGGELLKIDYSDLDDANPLPGAGGWHGEYKKSDKAGWAGFTDPYWLTALAPAAGRTFHTMIAQTKSAMGQPIYAVETVQPKLTIAPGGSASVTTRLFAGAKEVSALRDYEYLLDGKKEPASFAGRLSDYFFHSSTSRFVDAVDWGWFFFLTKPIFELLAALNAAIGNMGVAIILLTVVFKTLLFPLAYKSYVSMSRMKKLQPEMKKIQERYGEDRMRMQQEMMALYKREKANPAAGCLPILAQIPIFFSLYKVLVVSIELRHAPFFAWVQDLSAPDPTSILNLFGLLPWDAPAQGSFLAILSIGVWPILMGITMWLQQLLNPAPTDPTQEKIFNMLPILFTFMLGTFASGLVIYWTANNLLTIIQQYTIMRSQGVEVELLANIKKKLGLAPKESQS